jgi:hypothetical protein
MRSLQKELDDLREARTKERERDARRAREDEEELRILRDRCESLEDERANRNGDVRFVFQLFISNITLRICILIDQP